MKDRTTLAKESKAVLVHEWDAGKERYRLVAVGKFSAGYEDEYVIEQLGADAIGEPKWTGHARWKPEPGDVNTLLVAAIKSLQSGSRPS